MTAAFFASLAESRHGWFQHAACRGLDPNLFFPEKRGYPASEAKAVCALCSVRDDCLDYAMSLPNKEPGIYGGTDANDRRRLRRERREAGSARRQCRGCAATFPAYKRQLYCSDACSDGARKRTRAEYHQRRKAG